METLFFVIQICGLLVIAFWAHRNDQRASIAEQNGLLAMLTPDGDDDRKQAPPPPPNVGAAPRRPPPRRRFVAS